MLTQKQRARLNIAAAIVKWNLSPYIGTKDISVLVSGHRYNKFIACIHALVAQRHHWKANHDHQVEINRKLRQQLQQEK